MKDLLNWLTTSSANPQQLSLTIKGFLTGIAPIGILPLGLNQTDFGTLTDTIVNVVFWITSLIAGIQVLFGILRKMNLGRWSAYNE